MKKIFYLMIAFTLTLSSCNDYLDVNSSNNYPHTSSIIPPALLANALSTTFITQAVTMNEYGNLMTNYWSGNTAYYTQPYSTEFTMNFTTSTRQGIWNGLYTGMANFNNMIVYPNDSGVYDNHVAIAKIMKSYYMEYIVALYGNAPYSKSFNVDIQHPSYDNDKAIYADLFNQLESAKAMLNGGGSVNASSVGAEDIVFNGDLTSWVKFANTIELKMCLRLSNVTDPTSIALREQYLALLSGAEFVDSDVKVNPGYNNSTESQYNPFSLYYSKIYDPNAGGATYGSYSARLACASSYVAKVLMANVNQPGGIVNTGGTAKDPRRGKMFIANSSGNIIGIDQGVSTMPTPSLVGSGLTGFTGLSAIDAFENAESKPGFLMTKAESLFLQAEAEYRSQQAINNFNGGVDLGFGDPHTLFDSAVSASFDFFVLPLTNYTPLPLSTTAATYLGTGSTGVGNKLGLGWAGTPDKLQVILTQKWLAVSGINGMEPFLDKLRTGFPNNPLSTNASQPNSPYRLLYPASEYSNNSANVPNVSLSQIFVKNQFTPFWLQ